MYNMFHVLLMWIATIFITLFITPFVKKLSIKIGALDQPNKRRMNKVAMPTMGGVSIYLGTFISLFILQPVDHDYLMPIFIASTVIIVTGVIDDTKDIKPVLKMVGIILAALIIYFYADISVDVITLPFFGMVNFGWLSLPVTIIWIVSITNAINLIDGLDGLASGVSVIALTTMGVIGYFFLTTNRIPLTIFVFTVVFAIIGYLPFNFYPASIYLGDTGALFLGFIISVVSLQGLKNATFISFIIPIVTLGVPITDTFFAIVRRTHNKRPISSADKNHLHHRLMSLGLTHRQTVLFLYMFAILFSIIALLFPISSKLGTILLLAAVLLGIEIFAEAIGLVSEEFTPVLTFFKKILTKINRK